MPTLDIIIVNWNAGEYLRECLLSIVEADKSGLVLGRVVVVDNGSLDESLERLPQMALPLRVLRNGVNRGFAAACNQGAAGSQADFLLFLNPDATLFANSLQAPLEFLQKPENSRVGIAGVRLVNGSGVTVVSCARFPSLPIFLGKMTGLHRLFPRVFPKHLLTSEECRHSTPVDQVIGAFFLVRRPLFEALHGFDERFFVYFEEVDFAYRAKRMGWLSYYLADVAIHHTGCVSSDQIKARRLFYSLRSRIQYAFKHFSTAEALALAALTLTVELAARIAWALFTASLASLEETLSGYSLLLGHWMRKGLR